MTHIRSLSLALISALAMAPAAHAQDATASGKKFAVTAGYSLSEPTSTSTLNGGKADFDGDGAPTVSATYNINDNIGIEAWGAADKFGHRVRTADGKVASVGAQPVALSAQYHFRTADSTVRPFVGLGYQQTNYSEETAQGGSAIAGQRVGVETSRGAMATAGIDVNITPRWFARADVRYLDGNSDIKLDGQPAGEAKLNPVVAGVSLGARF